MSQPSEASHPDQDGRRRPAQRPPTVLQTFIAVIVVAVLLGLLLALTSGEAGALIIG